MNDLLITAATRDEEIVEYVAEGWATAVEQGESLWQIDATASVMGYIRYLQHQRDLMRKGQGDA
jgi:hypothetical protein